MYKSNIHHRLASWQLGILLVFFLLICTLPIVVSAEDTTAPTVKLTNLTEGRVLGGNFTVKAWASDNVGVVGVEFFIDGGIFGKKDTLSPYSSILPTSKYSNGTHLITAVGKDAAGNSTTAQPISITIYNKKVLDVTYCEPLGKYRKMDIYYPAMGTPEPMPVAVYIHGGGWGSDKSKYPELWLPHFTELNNRGYLVASLNYRTSPTYAFPAHLEDIKCAVRDLKANAEHYGIDPDRIGAWGHSAGAHLSAMLATTGVTDGFEGSGPYQEESSKVHAFAGIGGPYDLTVSADFSSDNLQNITSIFGGREAASSPVTYVNADDTPALLIHGRKDTVVLPHQSELMLARLEALNFPATLLLVDNGGHTLEPVPSTATPSLTNTAAATVIADFFDQYVKIPYIHTPPEPDPEPIPDPEPTPEPVPEPEPEPTPDPVDVSLVGHWTFDNSDIVGTTVNDETANGNNGTIMGLGTTAAGVIGEAFNFDSVNDYINFGDDPDFEITFPVTFSAWINLDVSPTHIQAIISKYAAAKGQREWEFAVNANGTMFFGKSTNGLGSDNMQYAISNTVLAPRTWHHVAVTIDASGNYTFYLNGVADGTGTFPSAVVYKGTAHARIGAVNYSSTNPDFLFDGKIDDVRMYERVLSDTEVSALHSSVTPATE